MTGEQTPGERKADLARTAVSIYARSAARAAAPQSSGWEPEPGTNKDHLASQLCGLMHYADSRKVSFDDALSAARDDYLRERATYLPGDPVARPAQETSR